MLKAGLISKVDKEDKEYSDHIRVVLLGKTGNGKSSTGNSLIGENVFKTGSSVDSITTQCQAVTFELLDKKILLVDTPGEFKIFIDI